MAMTVDNIIDRVVQKIQEESIDVDFILEALNQCNVHIATVIDIKELSTVSETTLLAGANVVPLPTGFHKKLVFAYNKTTNERVRVYDSRRLVDRKLSITGTTGNVISLCNDFPNIYYQYKPSSNQLVDVYYHKLPSNLIEGGLFPAYVPDSHVYRVFFNYVVSQCYDFLEDGMEGDKVNTTHHNTKFETALNELKLFIGPDPDHPDMMMPNGCFDFNY
jgi:hypothetical protein